MDDFRTLPDHLTGLFATDERPPVQRDRLLTLMDLLATLPPPPDPYDLCPDFGDLQQIFLRSLDSSRAEPVEEAFLNLYCHLHGHRAPYTDDERQRMDASGGYWCHAGGLSPILRAGEHIGPATVSADFGAGNGLQGLLLQKLFPHARTVQVEISSRMVTWGKALQQWLGIDRGRVDWVVGDVLEQSVRGLDFIYLYRPVRPEGPGRRFYEKFAAELAAPRRRVVIFSIADCLKPFMGDEYEVFYSDGHLTCYRNV